MTKGISKIDPAIQEVDSTKNIRVGDVVGNKNDTPGGNSVVALLKQVLIGIGGEATQLRTSPSISSSVEEDGVLGFSISLMDIDSGVIVSANIDITGISVSMEKSTGGGAFSSAGITQPVFTKANGIVEVDYRFLAAEWAVGDIYKLTVSGITVTIGSDTAYVRTMMWSNKVSEDASLEAKVDAIQVDIGNPSARTNFQNLEDMIGIPDAADSSLDDILRTGFDSSGISADEDGAIIEILKYIIDNLNSGVADLSDDYNYTTGTTEQTVIELTSTTKKIIQGAMINLKNMTQNGTIKVYYDVNNSGYEEGEERFWVQGTDKNVQRFDINLGTKNDFKITYQASVSEGADRTIPYEMIYEEKE